MVDDISRPSRRPHTSERDIEESPPETPLLNDVLFEFGLVIAGSLAIAIAAHLFLKMSGYE